MLLKIVAKKATICGKLSAHYMTLNVKGVRSQENNRTISKHPLNLKGPGVREVGHRSPVNYRAEMNSSTITFLSSFCTRLNTLLFYQCNHST